MNFYLMMSLVFTEELRQLKFYPLLLQAFCDFLATGCGGLALYIVEANNYRIEKRIDRVFQLFANKKFSDFLAVESTLEERYWIVCMPRVLVLRLSEYFTGPITLVITVERFLMVVKPHSYEEILSRKNRLILYTTLTLLIVLMTAIDVLIRSDYRLNIIVEGFCSHGFWGRRNYIFYSSLATAFVFFFVPAVTSLALYCVTLQRLIKMKTNVARNRVLTVAFFSSCVCWIFLWSISYFLRSMHFHFGRKEIFIFTRDFLTCLFGYEHFAFIETFLFVSIERAHFLTITSSVMNPFCLLVVCKVFWTPIIDAYNFFKRHLYPLVSPLYNYMKQSYIKCCKRDNAETKTPQKKTG